MAANPRSSASARTKRFSVCQPSRGSCLLTEPKPPFPIFPKPKHIRAKAIVGEARVDGDQMLVKISGTLGDL